MRLAILFLLWAVPALAQVLPDLGPMPQQVASTGFIVTNFNDIIVNHLTSGTFASSLSTYTIGGSTKPAPNSLIMVDVVNTKATIADSPTSITAFGLTFNQLTNCPSGTSSTNNHTLWIAQGAAPTSTTIAVAFPAAQLGCIIECYEVQNAFVGASAKNAIVQFGTNGTTAASANPVFNYSTPSGIGTNIMWLFIADNVNDTTSLVANTNWFRHEKIAIGTTPAGLATHFQSSCLNASSATVTATSRAWSMIGLEIKPSAINDPTTQPVMVQHKSWNNVGNAGTPPGDDIVGPGRKFFTNYLSNVTLAGNMLFIHLVYDQTGDASRHVTLLSDNQGNAWTKLAVPASITNQDVFENYILPNNPGGVTWFNVNFSSGVSNDCHIEFGEFAHIATSSPLDIANFSTPTSISMDYGSITSTIDGDLIIGCALDVQNGSINGNNNISSQFYQGGGHFLSTQSHLVGCSGYYVQTKAAQVDPLLLVAGGNSADLYVGQVMAFKKSSAGTMRPTNIIYVARMQQEWTGSGTTMTVPFEGNLIVVSDSDSVVAGSNTAWASFPVSGSSLWTIKASNTGDGPQFGYLSNSIGTKGIPIQIKVTTTHAALPGFSYDVFFASAFPFDAYGQYNNGGASSPQNSQITGGTNVVTVAGDLVIEECTTGTGPFAPYVGPTGAVFDSTWYPFSGDLNKLNQGTANGSYYSSNLTAVFFTLQFSNSTSTSWCDNTLSFKNGNH